MWNQHSLTKLAEVEPAKFSLEDYQNIFSKKPDYTIFFNILLTINNHVFTTNCSRLANKIK